MGQQGEGSIDAYVGSEPPSNEPPELDGEVTSSAEIVSTAGTSGNAGKSYYMRGGSYGNLTLSARPSSLITFITYPGESVTFGDVRFEGARNLKFDGNEENRVRSTAGGFPDGTYGLWIRGTGTTGFDIEDVPECLVFLGDGSGDVENITLANFRMGDDMSEDPDEWRAQHGAIFLPGVYSVTFEDFEIAYLGADLADFDPGTGDGDLAGGGLGLFWFHGGSTDYGDFTFTRGHFHHTLNDFVHYGPNSPTATVLFEDCLFEELSNFGDAHADMLQIFGGSQALTYEGCVFREGTDYILHGDVTGQPRTFTNCLIGDPNGDNPNINNFTLGRDNEGGIDAQFVFDDCTMQFINSLRLDSTAGASFTSDSKMRNCIYPGFSTVTGVVPDNVFANDGEANLLTDGGNGLSGDTTGSPTYNSQGECTSHSQGWRKPETFPWTL